MKWIKLFYRVFSYFGVYAGSWETRFHPRLGIN